MSDITQRMIMIGDVRIDPTLIKGYWGRDDIGTKRNPKYKISLIYPDYSTQGIIIHSLEEYEVAMKKLDKMFIS